MSAQFSIWPELFLENALYGGFFVLYSISSILLLQRRRLLLRQTWQGYGSGSGVGRALDAGDKKRLQTMRFWEITGAMMFVVVTLHWMMAWVLFIGDPPDESAELIQFTRLVFGEITILLGDLVMIHRLWVVGDQNKVLIAFPFLALTSFFAFAIPFSWQYYLVYAGKPIPFLLTKNYWLVGLVVSTLGVNIYCTSAITWKIWRTNRVTRRFGSDSLMHVAANVIESAGIYSLWMVALLGLVITLHPLYITFYGISTELYGVSTMLISVRVGLGWATGDNGRVDTSTSNIPIWKPSMAVPTPNQKESIPLKIGNGDTRSESDRATV